MDGSLTLPILRAPAVQISQFDNNNKQRQRLVLRLSALNMVSTHLMGKDICKCWQYKIVYKFTIYVMSNVLYVTCYMLQKYKSHHIWRCTSLSL